MAWSGHSASWATAFVGFGLVSLPIAQGSAGPFSVETGLWILFVWVGLLRTLAYVVGAPRNGAEDPP